MASLALKAEDAPDRLHKPEVISRSPVRSCDAFSKSMPMGDNTLLRAFAAAVNMPDEKSISTATAKNITKELILMIELRVNNCCKATENYN